jgi:hypothetical protein
MQWNGVVVVVRMERNSIKSNEQCNTRLKSFFCFSIRSQLRQWTTVAADPTDSSSFRRSLSQWSRLPAASPIFGLEFTTLEQDLTINKAIRALQALGSAVTPSWKMEHLLEASYAISANIGQSELLLQSSMDETDPWCVWGMRMRFFRCSYLPARSNTCDPFHNCALLSTMFPFEQAHGERMYYLTMFEAALVFIRMTSNL